MTSSRAKTKKNITLAQHAGFCYGVKRAVETTKKLKLQNPNKEVFVLGIATSIDALSIGITFTGSDMNVLQALFSSFIIELK